MTPLFKGTLLIIFLIVGMGAYYAYHENAHIEIYKSYGVNPRFDFTFGKASLFGNCPNEECTYLHNLNEVFGYHTAAVTLNLWLMLVVFLVWREK